MAVSNPTLIGAGQSGNSHGTGSFTTGSLTIPSSCLLIIHVGAMINGGASDPSGSFTCVASLGGVTTTPVAAVGVATSWSFGQATWYANVTTGGSSTFTFDCGAENVYNYNWSVAYVTGHDTSTPIGSADDTETALLSTALTLDTAPASTSLIIAAVVGAQSLSDSVTPGSGWVEISDINNPSGGAALQSQYRAPGSTATTVLLTANTADRAVGHAFEILEAAGGTSGTATPAAIVCTTTLPAVTTGPTPTYIQGQNAAITSSRSPSVTFGAGVQTGDVVYFYCSTTITPSAITTPAGWVNVLATSTTTVDSDSNMCCGIYHIVTSGENGTTAFTATNLFNAVATGNVLAAVIRYVDLTTPIDNSGSTFNSGNSTTPHVLAAITGTGSALSSNSLVISGVSKDLTGTYTTPGTHTQRQTNNSTSGTWLGTHNTLTTANTDVTAVNITPSAGDEFCSISVAFTKLAPTGAATATPAVIARSVVVPAVTPQAGTVKVAPLIASTVAVPQATATNSDSATATPIVITSAGILPAPTTQGGAGATAAPTVIARVVALPAPTLQAGSTTAPAVISCVVVIDQATASGAATGTAAPAVIARNVVLPAPVTQAGSSGVPTVIARAVALPAPTPQASKTTSPTVIARSVVMPAATASGATTGTATPAIIARVIALPAPTTQAGSSGTPTVLALSITLPAPTASAPVAATALPATITLTLVMPYPAASGAGVYALYVGTNPVTAAYLGTTLIDGGDIHLADAVGLFAAAGLFTTEELAVALLTLSGWYYGADTVEAVYLGDTLITDIHVGAP